MPAIVLLAGSRDNRVTGLQIGAKNADAMVDAGQSNRFENVEFIGYGDAEAAVRWLAGSTSGSLKGGEAKQFKNIAANEAGTEAGHRVTAVDSSSISGAPFVGFGGGKNSVTTPFNSDATPYYERTSPILDLPWGLGDKPIAIIGAAGNIDGIRPGEYFGEIVRIRPLNGMTIRDTALTENNIVLRTEGSTIAATGRVVYAFQWDDGAWRMARGGGRLTYARPRHGAVPRQGFQGLNKARKRAGTEYSIGGSKVKIDPSAAVADAPKRRKTMEFPDFPNAPASQ